MSQVEQAGLLHQERSKAMSGSTKVSIVLVTLTLIGTIIFTAIKWNDQDTSEDQRTAIIDQDLSLDSYLNSRIKSQDRATRIKIKVFEDSDNELTLKISDSSKSGFELPEDSPYLPNNDNSKDSKTGERSYEYTLNKKTGAFILKRKSTNEVLFDTTNHQYIVSKDYSQFGTSLNQNSYLYGLGERRKLFRYTGTGNYTTWPKDQFAQMESGQPSQQLYGYHPMWLVKEEKNKFHIGFLKSTSALLTQIDAGQRMVFHVVGGNLVIKFILGKSDPEELVQSYHRYIHGFGIHPFWSQGYHQCRWGYKTSQQMLDVIQSFTDGDHPIESIWNDLDYMTNYQDFTLDTDNFKIADMNTITDLTTNTGVRWIPLLDIGVATNTYADEEGLKQGIFLQSSVYGKELEGCVWPGPVHFPDFNNPKAEQYWLDMTNYMRDTLKVSPGGYWIDMNELASFIPGERDTKNDEDCYGANPPAPPIVKEAIDDRLYVPVTVSGTKALADKTITLSTKHYSQADALLIKNNPELTEQYFHALNNLAEQIVTDRVLKKFTDKKLQFSLTRASIYGSGRYTTHWTGDNYASWDMMRLAVSELLPFQFYGIPMVGNDLCGFAGNTNAELCARWQALGAWEPLARNHNDNESISQEPTAFPESPYVLTASKAAFQNRYTLLKWMYSLFLNQFESQLQAGTGTIIQPIWWLDVGDVDAFNYEDDLFIFGKTFLIAPVLSQGDPATLQTTKTVYFPKGFSWLGQEDQKVYEGGKTLDFVRNFEDMALAFQKEGTIVFRQQYKSRARLLDNHFDLEVFLDKESNGHGAIITQSDYDENVIAENCMEKGNCICRFEIHVDETNKSVSVKVSAKDTETVTNWDTIIISKVTIINNTGTKLLNAKQWNQEIKKAEEFTIQY